MIALIFGLVAVQAAAYEDKNAMAENPIRRIVSLLQKMQTEVGEEAERDKDLSEKFECYCKTNDGELSQSTETLRNQIPQIEASIEEAVSLKAQLDQELAEHKSTRENAKNAIATATQQRQKENEVFVEASTELKASISSCKSATEALTKGLQGFLQTNSANILRNVVLNRVSLDRYARQTLTDFLSTSTQTHYTPVSGEIIGIISQLQEDMEADLADITKTENDAQTNFEGLVSAKEKEIQAATSAIESKTERAGATAVQIVSLKNDLEDVKDQLGADEVFLMNLKKDCGTKGGEYDERKAARAQELVAISETIKILNDDDALDLFKKTLDSPSFMQTVGSSRDLRNKALAELKKGKNSLSGPKFNFIALALHGKKQGFDKVIAMIDNLVVTMKKEQVDDDKHRDWCTTEFDQADDQEKYLTRRIAGFETRVDENEKGIAQLIEDLASLKQSIKETDRAVEDATTQRKDEHKNFVETATQNNGALQLLGVAKNRMAKFYNPNLYKAPERRALTEDEKVYVNSGGQDPRDAEDAAKGPAGGIAGTGITVFAQIRAVDSESDDVAPPPPPAVGEAYGKKDASGPVALIDKLSRDLEKDMQANEHDETTAQKDYEEFMSDSVAKRSADSKSVTEKEAQKAELEADLMAAKDQHASSTKELMATQEYVSDLHGSCDFLTKNYQLRKDARAAESQALTRAKAVLSGASYSFAQASSSKFLVRH